MKRTSTLARRPARRSAAINRTNAPRPRRVTDACWPLPDVDEGRDAPYRELIERIVRGERIRGHAL